MVSDIIAGGAGGATAEEGSKVQRLLRVYEQVATEYRSYATDLGRLRQTLTMYETKIVRSISASSSTTPTPVEPPSKQGLAVEEVQAQVDTVVQEQRERLARLERIQHQIDLVGSDE